MKRALKSSSSHRIRPIQARFTLKGFDAHAMQQDVVQWGHVQAPARLDDDGADWLADQSGAVDMMAGMERRAVKQSGVMRAAHRSRSGSCPADAVPRWRPVATTGSRTVCPGQCGFHDDCLDDQRTVRWSEAVKLPVAHGQRPAAWRRLGRQAPPGRTRRRPGAAATVRTVAMQPASAPWSHRASAALAARPVRAGEEFRLDRFVQWHLHRLLRSTV